LKPGGVRAFSTELVVCAARSTLAGAPGIASARFGIRIPVESIAAAETAIRVVLRMRFSFLAFPCAVDGRDRRQNLNPKAVLRVP